MKMEVFSVYAKWHGGSLNGKVELWNEEIREWRDADLLG